MIEPQIRPTGAIWLWNPFFIPFLHCPIIGIPWVEQQSGNLRDDLFYFRKII